MGVALVAAASASCSSSPPALSGTPHTLTYCDTPQAEGTLVLYQPHHVPTSPVPVVVFVHGGAWELGNSSVPPGTFIGDVEEAVVGRGWLFASVNYRLAPSSRWPAMIDDTMCAVRFLRADAAALHVDPARIGAVGASAGGQLVSLLGVAPQRAGFDVGQYSDESSNVDAVVDEFGPSDLNAASWSTTPLARQISAAVFGVPPTPPSPVLADASPVTWVSAGDPPFLVIQGAEDTVVAASQSEELVTRLRASGDSATLVLVRNAGHGLVRVGGRPISPSVPALADRAVQFLEQNL